jgi:hypothetical protein
VKWTSSVHIINNNKYTCNNRIIFAATVFYDVHIIKENGRSVLPRFSSFFKLREGYTFLSNAIRLITDVLYRFFLIIKWLLTNNKTMEHTYSLEAGLECISLMELKSPLPCSPEPQLYSSKFSSHSPPPPNFFEECFNLLFISHLLLQLKQIFLWVHGYYYSIIYVFHSLFPLVTAGFWPYTTIFRHKLHIVSFIAVLS